jgi:hypothetical protein
MSTRVRLLAGPTPLNHLPAPPPQDTDGAASLTAIRADSGRYGRDAPMRGVRRVGGGRPSPTRLGRIVEKVTAANLRAVAQAVLGGDLSPFDGADRMKWIAVEGIGAGAKVDDDAWAHWLIWGSLGDWREWPAAHHRQAEEWIRQASREWLEVEDDEAARLAFCDRWVYDICGYARSTASEPN